MLNFVSWLMKSHLNQENHAAEVVDYSLNLFSNKTSNNNVTGKNCHHAKNHALEIKVCI